ncbi:MAG: methyl-accepting chemotaxis protein [Spirochaetota bacterium]|nr:methyl-accepting chemotaxis protein [Spirochaetota bacterium]
MIRPSLRSKILSLVFASVVSVILAAVISASIASSLMSEGLTKEAQERADIILDIVSENMDSMAQKLKNVLAEANNIPGIAAAARDRNKAAAQSICREIMAQYDLSLVTLLDANGIVIGRGFSETVGDDLSKQESIRQALTGTAAYGVETAALVSFALRGAAPVYYNGEIIGCLSIGFTFVTADKHDFVDPIKKRFNVECTLFQDNLRISTTIINDKGARAIGTTLDNTTILQTVLSNGQVYYGKNIILGNDYISAYHPLKNSSGKTSGILFVGIQLSEVLDSLHKSISRILTEAGLVCVLLFLGGFILARNTTRAIASSTNRIEKANAAAEDIAGQVLHSSKNLANAANTQSATMEETTALVGDITAHTNQTTDAVKEAEKQMQSTQQSVKQAGDSLEALVSSMTEISETSNNILSITKTINEIAFQTNLLALNAAVEAARAGEAGAGFAVVANEVRSLAMRSSQAVQHTEELVEESKEKIQNGVNLAQQSSTEFSGVTQNAAAMGGIIDTIARNANNQAQGIEQINRAVGEMNSAIHTTAKNAETVNDLSQRSISETAKTKEAAESLFRVVFGGRK